MSAADDLASATRAIAREIAGGFVQDVRGGEDLLALRVRSPGRTQWLGLSALAGAAGPLLQGERPPRERHATWDRIRAALEGARIVRLSPLAGEAAAWLETERAGRITAVLARFGGSPEIALVEDGVVVASLHGRMADGSACPTPSVADEPEAPACDLEAWTRRLADARHERLRERRVVAARTLLQRALRGARRRLAAREADLERLGDGSALRDAAEALGAFLHEVPRGSSELVVPEWGDPPRELRVALDPAAAPSENLRRAHAKASRAVRGREKTSQRIAESRVEVEDLERRLTRLESAAQPSELDSILAGLSSAPGDASPKPRGSTRQVRALPYREYRSRDGLVVLVGRSGRGNDELTFKVARGNDLWLHARGAPGPHVVVRMARGADPPAETLLDAATLAHAESARGDEPRGEVTWCRVKDVRRRRGEPPGSVDVAHERVIALRVEPERLERLKRSDPP